MKITGHYNDEKMVFDEISFEYKLTIQEAKENFDITFSNDGILKRRIEKNSNRVYNYIYRMVNSLNLKKVEILLNETEEGRRFIHDVLLSQIEADLATGFNTLADQPQIDLKTGRVIQDQEIIKNGLVSVSTKMIIENSQRYFKGINIMSAVPFNLMWE